MSPLPTIQCIQSSKSSTCFTITPLSQSHLNYIHNPSKTLKTTRCNLKLGISATTFRRLANAAAKRYRRHLPAVSCRRLR
ncbi:hypothetical protein HanIR_Chr02g0074761 [Helianthus annuus]|nr:hypothetical protein HanIR_Chr02g0074761 [Helianthus annuus]